MISKAIVRRLAEDYIRICESGLGAGDTWLMAVDAAQCRLTPEQLDFLAGFVNRDFELSLQLDFLESLMGSKQKLTRQHVDRLAGMLRTASRLRPN